MHVPSFLTVPCFLAAFVLFGWQYYVADPERRIMDRRFLLASASLLLALLYVSLDALDPLGPALSSGFFAAGLGSLLLSLHGRRRPRGRNRPSG